MQVVALIGSLRQKSYNRAVFNHYRKISAAEFDLVEGVQQEIPLYNDDLKEKGIPAPVVALDNLLRNSAGLMFFSPEYNYSVPGFLKNTLDWLSRVPNPAIMGKKVSILSASPGKLGGARMQYHLRQIGVFFDLQIMNRPEVMISEIHKKISENGEINDADTIKFLASHLEHWIGFLRK